MSDEATPKKKCMHCNGSASHAALEPGKGNKPVAHLCDKHLSHKKWNWNLVPLNPPAPPPAPEKKARKPKAAKAAPPDEKA